MPSNFKRTDRIADVMQRELAVLIQRKLKDPRLHKFITVSAVTVTSDLEHAKVYVSVLDEDANIPEIMEALQHAAGFLRSELAHLMDLRRVPELHFVYDQSIQEGRKLSNLIDQALKRESHNEEDDDSEKR